MHPFAPRPVYREADGTDAPHPAPPEATSLECYKMSKTPVRHHFNSMFGCMLEMLTPEEKAARKGITIDSYEVGAQNWTDGFAAEFEKRNGYNPLLLLPVMTGRVFDSAKTSDQFLWDLRRTVADMIAENYVGGLPSDEDGSAEVQRRLQTLLRLHEHKLYKPVAA